MDYGTIKYALSHLLPNIVNYHLCFVVPPSKGCRYDTKLISCAPLEVTEIRTNTCSHHEETIVLPISVCAEHHGEFVRTRVRGTILSC